MREAVIPDVLDYVAGRASAKTGVDAGDRAERTGKRASAGGLHHTRDKEMAPKEVISRSRQSGERLGCADVAAAEPTGRGVLEQLSPDRLGLSNHYAIDMLQRLIRIECDMRTARDDWFSAFSELVSKTVGLWREAGEEGECDEISAGIEVDRLYLLVNHTNLVVRRRQGCEMNTSDRRNEVSLVPVPVSGQVNDHYLDTEGTPFRRTMWRGQLGFPL